MSKYNTRDTALLTEAYAVQLIKESLPKMTLAQLEQKIPLLTEGENQHIEQFSEKIIEEFFGGMKALAGAGGRMAGKAAQGVVGGLKSAAQGAVQGAKGLAQGAVQGAKQAAGQVGSNVKDIYNTSEDSAQSKQAVKQATTSAQQLVQLIQSAQQKGLVTFSGDPMTMTLEDIVDELVLAQQGAGNLERSAQKKGVFGGAGKAFQKGFRA